MADEVLQQALELDVDKEVQRRYEAARKQFEESGNLESSRSAVSQSIGSGKPKKNVKFADEPSNKKAL
jgi:hypothetical protein